MYMCIHIIDIIFKNKIKIKCLCGTKHHLIGYDASFTDVLSVHPSGTFLGLKGIAT